MISYNERKEALFWWNIKLTLEERIQLGLKYKPYWNLAQVTMSTITIMRIHQAETIDK